MIKRILNSSFNSVASRFFITSTNLLIVYFISKKMGNIELGNYGIMYFFYILFSVLTSQGMYLFFAKEIAKFDRKSSNEKRIINEFITITITGVLISVVFPFVIILFYNKISFYMLFIASFAGYITGVERNLGGILLGQEKMHIESLSSFLSFTLIASILISQKDYFNSIEKIFILRLVILFLVVLFRLWYLRDNFTGSRISLRMKMFREGKYYWFGALSNVSLREIDVLILSFFIDKPELGTYFLALRIYFAFSILAEVISFGFTPFISRAYSGKETSSFEKLNRKLFLFFFVAGSVLGLSLIFTRNLILDLFSAGANRMSGRYLFFLSFLLVFRFFSFYTGAILSSTEFQRIRFNISFSASIMMIVLNIVLGSVFKVEGILTSRAVVELFIFIAFLHYVNKIVFGFRGRQQV